ncbi:Serine/threonine-protein kinase PknB [Aquisphaera giovannonii]|uniref:Serine/threonine-protein kinase PknB n=1 Tax=Aquisphaera giovannonii TaxID=406548 RepID=A0A5B9VWL7_9BACT|nr:serine/threonine-protein kinase [Aquisphaera giovannonii]QEH32261.1 Serine/threonine-protein kinase PknB [Aquisphaera giovannonii]
MAQVEGSTEVLTAPVVPGHELIRLLGAGGMGRVYLARQVALGRLVCVKVLAIPDLEDPILCRARFRRESELLAGLSHPHIIALFDYGVTADSDLPYLATEYIEGGDLRSRMKPGRPMPRERVREILHQVGDALEHLHGKGIIHRDLKPENILMPTETLCKVCDFGLAVLQESAGSLTRSGRGLGTLGYVSPEQQRGDRIDERSDQYSLAALAYELLTGKRPLGRFRPPSRVNAFLPAGLDAAILRGLEENPADRYESVAHFVRAIEPYLDPDHVGAGRLSPRARRAALGGVAILAALAGLVALARGIPGADRRPPADPPAPPAQVPAPEPRSAEFRRLTELRAYLLWVAQGRPNGNDIATRNWLDAEKLVEGQVNARAYELWVRQGRPEGAEGAAAAGRNRRDAERQLLKEVEEEARLHPPN